MGPLRVVFAFALLIPAVLGGGIQVETNVQQRPCSKTFQQGRDDFVLDTVESIKHGATFLANPTTEDCTAACCNEPKCNLALIEHESGKGPANSCFLFNCMYKKKYVCRFTQKKGFSSQILSSVYDHYLNLHQTSKDVKDRCPIANPGRDIVVQPQDEVMLNGIESWDDQKITNYDWKLVSGDQSAVLQKTDLADQMRVSNLMPGAYEFQLTVTDAAQQSDAAKVNVLVLNPEQAERHCLVPQKVGPCRGSFPRWHYNAASSKCEQFHFGGCKENNNNYVSEQECMSACKNTMVVQSGGGSKKGQNEVCSPVCGVDQFRCSNGCCLRKEFECDGVQQCSDGSDEQSCEKLTQSLSRLLQIEVNKKAHCAEPPVTGACRASFTRWYYDPIERKCHRFNYGGCDGNANNFDSKEACMKDCSGVTENDVFARGAFARSGGSTDSDSGSGSGSGAGDEIGESQSAAIALGVVLAVALLALLAILTYCCLKNKRKNRQHQRVATTPPVVYSDGCQQQVYNTTTAKP